MIPRILLTVAVSITTFAAIKPTSAADKDAIKVLIITGDHGHNWKETTPFLKEVLSGAGIKVDVTETPTKDLGHDVAAMKSAGFQKLLIRGVEWCAGSGK